MSARRLIAAVVLGGLTALSGCSHVKFKKADDSSNGLRYYLPATYLLITPDYAKQTANVTWVVLPDTKQQYAADPWSFMATNQTELTFDKGLLTKVVADSNSSAVPKAAIAAVNEIVKSALQTASRAAVAAGGFTVSPGARDAGSPSPKDAIFLFKIDNKDGREVATQLYPPLPAAPQR